MRLRIVYVTLIGAALGTFTAATLAAGPTTAPVTRAASAKAAAAPPAAAAPADVASVSHPTGEKHLRVIHDRFLKRIKDDNKIDLLFVGDSITQGWSKALDVWNAYYGKYDAANFGDGGDYTQHVLWRLENGELDGIHPKVVVLLVGINNLYHTPGNTPAETAAGIGKILDTIHQKLPETKVLLLGIFPYNRGKDSIPRATGVNAIISKFDDGQKTRYLSIWNEFLQPDGTISKEIMSDSLHPTAKGYAIWAKAMQPLLDEMMK